jgi:hypothetical protein
MFGKHCNGIQSQSTELCCSVPRLPVLSTAHQACTHAFGSCKVNEILFPCIVCNEQSAGGCDEDDCLHLCHCASSS